MEIILYQFDSLFNSRAGANALSTSSQNAFHCISDICSDRIVGLIRDIVIPSGLFIVVVLLIVVYVLTICFMFVCCVF